MIIKSIDEGVEISGVEKFSLEETFECGQCFRWNKVDDKYYGVAFNRSLCVYYMSENIIMEGTTPEEVKSIWIKYFDLDRNYIIIREELSRKDDFLRQACNFCPGIRILNQDPWETLCSFIISQNNNIPRIKGIISRLCKKFGDKIGNDIFTFPSAKTLSKLMEDDLKEIRSGFRAGYIIDAAKKISCGEIDLEKIGGMSLNDAREKLMSIKGVGPKVSECTLLYGFHKLEAFPMDVWMKRIMQELFKGKSTSFFGKYAGIAQQHLFHYTRMMNKQSN